MCSRVCLAFLLMTSLVACGGERVADTPASMVSAEPTETPVPTATMKPTDTPAPTATVGPTDTLAPTTTARPTDIPVPTATAEPTPTPAPTPIAQVVKNGGFESDTGHWDRPYGTLRRSTSEYNTGPGAAQLITSDPDGLGDYRGTFGQCIDLRGELGDWPELDGQKHLTLEAHLKTDASITSVTLHGIFLEDARCRITHVGQLPLQEVSGNQDWTKVSASALIPDTANSLHVFVWATGLNNSAAVYVDDIWAYPSSPDALP